MKIGYLIKIVLVCLIILPLGLHAQQFIKGQVVDSLSGSPLPGAIIRIGSSDGKEVTDRDGKFNIATSGNTVTLEFRYIGYHPKSVRSYAPFPSLMQVAMSPDKVALDQVVVSTGYQQLPMERSSGSVSMITAKELETQVSSDVLSRIATLASGISFDRTQPYSPKLMVRGISTINGDRTPLIVVDNFPYEGDLNDLDPNTVESISILKDASAASIWGSRAGNGVIIITTKKGIYKDPLQVQFNSYVQTTAKSDLQKVPMLNSSEFIDVEQMLYQKGFFDSDIHSSTHPALSPLVELLAARDAGRITSQQANDAIAGLREVDIRRQLSDEVYLNGFHQQYHLGLRGGGDKNRFNYSGGFDEGRDELGARNARYNLLTDQEFKITPKLDLRFNMTYIQQQYKGGADGINSISTAKGSNVYPYALIRDDSGKPAPLVRNYSLSYLTSQENQGLLNWMYYPVNDYQNNNVSTVSRHFTGTVESGFRFLKDFRASVIYRYETQAVENDKLNSEDSYYVRNLINTYTSRATNGQLSYGIPKGTIKDDDRSNLVVHQLRGQLNFQHQWGKGELNALAGVERRSLDKFNQSQRIYGFDPDTYTFGNVNPQTSFPTWVTGGKSYVSDGNGLSSGADRFLSFFGNASYTYMDKYTLTASMRKDASNLYGLSTNDKWNPLGSVGLVWNISKEGFYHPEGLPYLKLRASFGYSGNSNSAQAAVTTIKYRGSSIYTGYPYATFNQYENPELKWETVGMLNIGIDFRMKNNRIVGSVDFYRKRAKDLFGAYPVDPTVGIGAVVTKNVAAMKGFGVDLELNTQNIKSKNFQWSSQINLGYFKDEVTDYYLPNVQASDYVGGLQPGVSGLVGVPVYAIFSYRWAGLSSVDGSPQGYLDGKMSNDYNSLTGSELKLSDLVQHGSAIPLWNGAFTNTVGYARWNLEVALNFKLDYYFKKRSLSYTALYNNWEGNPEFSNRWMVPGDEQQTSVPSLVYPAQNVRDVFYAGSEIQVERGDHIRLQYINLSYSLPLKSASVKQIQFYVNAANLGILWRANESGVDPEYRYNSTLAPIHSVALGLRANLN